MPSTLLVIVLLSALSLGAVCWIAVRTWMRDERPAGQAPKRFFVRYYEPPKHEPAVAQSSGVSARSVSVARPTPSA